MRRGRCTPSSVSRQAVCTSPKIPATTTVRAGVELLGVDLAEATQHGSAPLPSALRASLLGLLDQHGVVLLRRQCLDDDELYRVSASFGRLEKPAAVWDLCATTTPASLSVHSSQGGSDTSLFSCRSPDYEELLYISNLNSPSGDFVGKQQDSGEQGCARLSSRLATPGFEEDDVQR